MLRIRCTFILSILCLTASTNIIKAKDKKNAPCPIVDTGQDRCYNNTRQIKYPKRSKAFFGQDAEYASNPMAYKDNKNGTITDLNTGLMWSKSVDKNKVSLTEAKKTAKRMTLGGHSDWRVPNIKELYSLIDFRGYTGFSRRAATGAIPANAIPFINTDYFDFEYGDTNCGERYIDAQWLTNTKYASTTMNGDETLFGVNFADGRIKGYGYKRRGSHRDRKKFFARYVRGKPYGFNQFIDNGNGTITDKATGLMWTQKDSGKPMNWEAALKFAENLKYAGHSDWRLPNAKELQYLVDYSRSPDTTKSPAIAPVFQTTRIKNEADIKDFPYFWTSTTHLDGPSPGKSATYVAFGRALGQMRGRIMDVHGAGAQRSDPKTGKPEMGHGPQGDARRVYNYVRCVRGGTAKLRLKQPAIDKSKYPYNISRISSRSSDFRQKRNDSLNRHFQRLDRNGDGKVSKSEFDGPSHHFDKLDRNRDGYLSQDEAPQGPPLRR